MARPGQESIIVYLSGEEKARIVEAAKEAGLSSSAFMRGLFELFVERREEECLPTNFSGPSDG